MPSVSRFANRFSICKNTKIQRNYHNALVFNKIRFCDFTRFRKNASKIGHFRGKKSHFKAKNKPFNAQNPTFRGWDSAFKSVFSVCFVACLGGVGCVPGRSRPPTFKPFRFLHTRVQTQCGGNGRKDADNGLDNHFPGFSILHIQLRFYVKVCRDAACCVRPFWRCSVRPC